MTLAPADRKLPFTQAELDRRRELEAQLVELRSHKTLPLDEATYDAELERVLLPLAELYQTAQQRQKDAQEGTP